MFFLKREREKKKKNPKDGIYLELTNDVRVESCLYMKSINCDIYKKRTYKTTLTDLRCTLFDIEN